MPKKLFIAEKPSVAASFADALNVNGQKRDGYIESKDYVVTWCVGHLVTMSYPEKYDPSLKKWSLNTLPFIPEEYLYEVIPSVKKQFNIVKNLLTRDDVDCIYVCTDSGREGEYIYRLVEKQSGVKNKERKRVWIDSQTKEEIIRGVKEAKDLSEYDSLSDSAYLRAQEDYLMGINFSRILTLKYGNILASLLGKKYAVIAVGRVMTCVLGMIVRREREIRNFVKTPFYKINAETCIGESSFNAELKIVEDSKYYVTNQLYKNVGFLRREDALACVDYLNQPEPKEMIVDSIERKQEKKNPPLLYNLAELQNESSRLWKLSPDETLKVVQELYEKKMVTYPRTDARVLSTAVAKEITKNISGLQSFLPVSNFAKEILASKSFSGISKTKYVNDKAITDHYAIIPTGQSVRTYDSLNDTAKKMYEAICRRFLAIFSKPAVYQKVTLKLKRNTESFTSTCKVQKEKGYLDIYGSFFDRFSKESTNSDEEAALGIDILPLMKNLSKGMKLQVKTFDIKDGETKPPKRYNSGSMILAMENAGQLIEDETLREHIKGSGIGTSATRAEILKKLVKNEYIKLNKKTQILTPTMMGELIFDTVGISIGSLLNPELTASWEKGLTLVASKEISKKDYEEKLDGYIKRRVDYVVKLSNQSIMKQSYTSIKQFYKK